MDSEDSSSASCRIVVVSSSLDTSREVANRIKALSGDTSEGHPSSEVIHWTIKNKYYTAAVHFHPIHLEGLESIELDDVPAVIYAWKENEPYKAHMKQVQEQTSSYEPEVSLAISMAPTTDEQLEDFFFEHGFEYIEGHSQVPERLAGLAGSSATAGISRALDALSTIMWPSMVRVESKGPKVATQPALSRTMEGKDEAYIDFLTLVNTAGSDGKSNAQHEMEMLEKWLQEDDDNYKRPFDADDNDYASLYSHEQVISTVKSDDPWPTEGLTTPGMQIHTGGFDDDFTEFISVPSASTESEQGAAGLSDEESDSDLPSAADIRAASVRIFGPSLSRSMPSDTLAALSDSPLATSGDRVPHDSAPVVNMGTAITGPELDMDAPTFDLTRILGTLEGMKDEISRIPDERERRRAAAKAALGLVYGLEDTNEGVDAAAKLT